MQGKRLERVNQLIKEEISGMIRRGLKDPRLDMVSITGVDVTDVDGAELQDATVSYTLGGPGWTAQDFEDQTDANGRSTWEVELVAGDSGSDPTLGVEVIAPNGEKDQASRVIEIP
jgi:hypothetical protein